MVGKSAAWMVLSTVDEMACYVVAWMVIFLADQMVVK